VVLITKVDIAAAVGFDRVAAGESIERVNPGVRVVEVSTRTGAGMEEWIALLDSRIGAKALAPAR